MPGSDLCVLVSERRLLAYGEDVGDTEVTSTSDITGERVSTLVKVPHGLPVAGQQVLEYLYVSGQLPPVTDCLGNICICLCSMIFTKQCYLVILQLQIGMCYFFGL